MNRREYEGRCPRCGSTRDFSREVSGALIRCSKCGRRSVAGEGADADDERLADAMLAADAARGLTREKFLRSHGVRRRLASLAWLPGLVGMVYYAVQRGADGNAPPAVAWTAFGLIVFSWLAFGWIYRCPACGRSLTGGRAPDTAGEGQAFWRRPCRWERELGV